MKQPLIILTGPTAVGKTAASIKLAKALNGEIISADSMQVDEIYQEAIVSSDEYKKEWSKMLGDCLKEFEYVIPFKYRYEYEINKAKQYSKNQKRGDGRDSALSH